MASFRPGHTQVGVMVSPLLIVRLGTMLQMMFPRYVNGFQQLALSLPLQRQHHAANTRIQAWWQNTNATRLQQPCMCTIQALPTRSHRYAVGRHAGS